MRPSSLPFVAIAAAALAAPALAQVADSSPFRRLPLPPPNEYRTSGGAPGRRYWQNRADYVIEARLDTASHQVRGSQRIRYFNNSPDSLPFVWLQVDQDIFAEGSINRSAPPPPLRFAGVPFDMTVNEPGGAALDSVRTSRGLAGSHRYDTMLRLDLERGLGPGDSVDIALAWRFRVPVNGVARMGRDGQLYQVAQWYPRMAVYDDVNGWNTMPYVGPGEFYLEYGDFSVRLTVPASFVVAATGELRNADTVLTSAQRLRLQQARASTQPVAVITRDEAGTASARPARTGTLAWQFTARNVRDFAWAASPDFRWDAARVDAGAQAPRLVQTFYRPGAANWEYAIRMAQHSVESFSGRWFPYPYPQASVVEGPIQGMEYPMIVFVPPDTSVHSLSWVLMHELGHEWFPMLVGSDERRYPWMDEGFNTFIDLYTVADWYRGRDDAHADSVLDGPLSAYPDAGVPGLEQPLITAPAESRNLYWTAYQKPALMLRLLREEVLGREAFDAALREYVRRWQFRHPQPADFFRTIENVSGRDLDWFWRGWIYTTARLDQAVDSVWTDNDTTRIALSSRGEMIMPLELRVSFDDGGSETRRLPVEIWNYGPRHTTRVAARDRRVVAVEVDPRGAYPDVDRSNNRWGSAPAAPARDAPRALSPAPDPPAQAAPPVAAPPAPESAAAEPRTPEEAIEAMRSDIAALARAQAGHFARAGRYTTDLAALGVRPSPGVTITIGYATELGWRALARHSASGTRCATFGGNATPPSEGAREGEAVCR